MSGIHRVTTQKLADDRYRIICVERPKRGDKDVAPEGAASSRVKADSQPEYRMKPNTGRIRRGKR